jgi:hypothetical protein
MKTLGLAPVLVLTGCSATSSSTRYQRFVLVPDPSQISKDIPAGALALDTKTGQLCYTVGGSFTSESPSIEMCTALAKNHPDSN